jgi:hypothetical protein
MNPLQAWWFHRAAQAPNPVLVIITRLEPMGRCGRLMSNEFDVLIVVEGKNLLEHASIEKLRDLVTDLQLIEGTRGIISLFSARQPPQGNELFLVTKVLPEHASEEGTRIGPQIRIRASATSNNSRARFSTGPP